MGKNRVLFFLYQDWSSHMGGSSWKWINDNVYVYITALILIKKQITAFDGTLRVTLTTNKQLKLLLLELKVNKFLEIRNSCSVPRIQTDMICDVLPLIYLNVQLIRHTITVFITILCIKPFL